LEARLRPQCDNSRIIRVDLHERGAHKSNVSVDPTQDEQPVGKYTTEDPIISVTSTYILEFK